MRHLIHQFLLNSTLDFFFLHPDIWPFGGDQRFINCGIIEQTITDIALGLAKAGKPCFVYGIAGFILYKGYESLKLYNEDLKAPLIILNAGANGCYDKGLGKGHQIHNDQLLCDDLGIDLFEPKYKDVLDLIKNLLTTKKISLIRLGYDKTNN